VERVKVIKENLTECEQKKESHREIFRNRNKDTEKESEAEIDIYRIP
jgi:hypothetical protein